MNNLLISEPPLQVLPSLAIEIGLNEAIVLQQFHYWLLRSRHSHDGYDWIYNSYPEWQKQFPFWSLSTLKRTIHSLENQEYLISGNYNSAGFDKTKWYRINYEKLMSHASVQNDPTMDSKWPTPSVQNGSIIGSKRTGGTVQNEQTNTNRLPEIIEEEEKRKLNVINHWTNLWGKPTGVAVNDLNKWFSMLSPDIVDLVIQAADEGQVPRPASYKYVSRTINRWLQGGVTTLEQAQKAIKLHNRRKENQPSFTKGHVHAKETLPDWAQNPSESKSNTSSGSNGLTEEERAALAARIARLGKRTGS